MSIDALDAALSGLRISQQQLNVISNNVANVGTEGYTRKILPQSTVAINGQAMAVRADVLIRKVDATLTRDVWTQISATSSLDTRLNYLQSIENFHGAPDAEASFAAEIADLRDTFSALADSPDDSYLLRNVLDQAVTSATKINDFANYVTELRNDTQRDMISSVNRVNELLEQIANLNKQIKSQINSGKTAAQLQDFRDKAVKDLAAEIDVSYFTRGDGVLVVQTRQGQELSAENTEKLAFKPTQLSPANYYPNPGVAGLFLRGDPNTTVGGVDLTQQNIGGKLGALIEMRDTTLPQYSAQIDEMAHKMAGRFAAQGLRLFTDASGSIPPDTPPTLDDPLTPLVDETTSVAYVGFASVMRVNQAVLNDASLLRTGTYGSTIQDGSNELIRRILEYGFGETQYQQALGTVSFAPADVGGSSLQDYLGLYSKNRFTGTVDLTSYSDTASIVSAADTILNDPDDVFRINFSDPDLGLSVDIDVDLSQIALQPPTGNFASDLVSYINTIAIPALPASDQADLTTMGATIQVGPSGQLQFLSRGDITVSADPGTVPNGMGNHGLVFLGFTDGTTSQATDPYFDIQVGNGSPVRISIDRDDTEVDLLAKLQSVQGLAVYDFIADADGLGGQIRLRPGNNYTNPDFGGDLKIIGGTFQTIAGGTAQGLIDDTDSDGVADTLATLPSGINIISALFGSIKDTNGAAGVTSIEISPVSNVGYLSETYAGSGEFVSFRTEHLGPYANIDIDIGTSVTLIDFAQKIISKQTQDVVLTQVSFDEENSFKEALEIQLQNDTGVNLDEELSNLIIIQTAYAAAARAVSAVDTMFQELINAVRR